jgi:uncharacterized membrane protein YfhO
MAKRHKAKQEALMLIPFLDILCSLIGVLCLIIVALCVAQTQKAKGYSEKQFKDSQKQAEQKKELKELVEKEANLAKTITEATLLNEKLTAQEKQKEELKQKLESSAQKIQENKEAQEKLPKLIAELTDQDQQAKAQTQALQDKIKVMKETLAARQLASSAKKEAKIVVRHTGSGLKNSSVFFAECSPYSLVLHLGGGATKSILPDSNTLQINKDYKDFLTRIKNTPNSSLIFLIRKDGAETYKNAAGLAEWNYQLRVSKIPLPSGGEVDTSTYATH